MGTNTGDRVCLVLDPQSYEKSKGNRDSARWRPLTDEANYSILAVRERNRVNSRRLDPIERGALRAIHEDVWLSARSVCASGAGFKRGDSSYARIGFRHMRTTRIRHRIHSVFVRTRLRGNEVVETDSTTTRITEGGAE
jgi:hypothetical protein